MALPSSRSAGVAGGGLALGAFGAALALPATEGPGATLLLGLPVRAALVLYGAGALPLVVLPLVYAWAFAARETDEGRRGDAARAGSDRA